MPQRPAEHQYSSIYIALLAMEIHSSEMSWFFCWFGLVGFFILLACFSELLLAASYHLQKIAYLLHI